jgi:hypothetical protein
MVTTVPTGPLGGDNCTFGLTIRSVELVPVPSGVVAAIGPVDAPSGICAVSCESDATRGRSSAAVMFVEATGNPPGVWILPRAATTTPRRPVVPLPATSRYSAPSNATLGETSFADDAE